MSEKTESGQPTPDESASAAGKQSRLAASGLGSKTVVNPERRRMALSATDQSVLPDVSIWRRLFPPADEAIDPANPERAVGLQLGHFVIEERIGTGGMGSVFRSLDTRLQRTVALKVLAPELSRDPSSVERFRNEARAAAQLDHENIARVFYIGEDSGLHFIAFEFIRGINVRELIYQQGRMDPAEAVNYVLQIASALNHTTQAGVVHRDIKPSNIIITDSSRAKLVDLGLARKESSASAADLTSAGTTLGTFDYISPEQAKDPRNVDVRSDIYSLGCTLYHMLTGEAPYPDGTVLQKLLDHQGKEPPDPAKKNARVSDDLSAVVRKMMASDPRRRYTTPDQLIRDLMLVAGSMGLRGVNPEGLVWMSSQAPATQFWQRNLGWMTTVAALLFIVVALNYFPRIGQNLHERNRPNLDGAAANSELAAKAKNGKSTDVSGAEPDGAQKTAADAVADASPTTQSTQIALLDGNATGGPSSAGPSKSSTGVTQPANPVIVNTDSNPPKTAPLINNVTDSVPPKAGPIEIASTEPATTVDAGSKPPLKIPGPSEDSKPPVTVPNTVANGNTAPQSSDPATATTEADDPQPFGVIGIDGVLGKKYRTLEAACASAADGSVIELRFNGSRRENPMRITQQSLTLRAAKGFQPLVEFVPVEVPGEGFQTRMITVTNGQINLNDLNLRMVVDKDFKGEQVALFSVQHPKQIRMQAVAVTIDNPERRAAAVFEIASNSAKTPSDVNMINNGIGDEPMEFELTGCFVRGNGDLFVVNRSSPGRFSLKNCVIALDGSLFHVIGNMESPPKNARLEVKLEHISAKLSNSLIRMDSGDLPRQLPPVHVSTRNNIFSNSATGSPLISMTGNVDDADFRRLLVWNGEKNFYDSYPIFWTFPSGQESLDFDTWKRDWGLAGEMGARNEGIVWKESWNDYAKVAPSGLALDRSDPAANPAVAGATDGSDAGADLEKLPILPQKLVPEPEEPALPSAIDSE